MSFQLPCLYIIRLFTDLLFVNISRFSSLQWYACTTDVPMAEFDDLNQDRS
jgi:hypothetical protein